MKQFLLFIYRNSIDSLLPHNAVPVYNETFFFQNFLCPFPNRIYSVHVLLTVHCVLCLFYDRLVTKHVIYF